MVNLALGYEGPATIGDVVAAAAIFVCIVVVALLAVRWVMAFLGEERKGRGPRARRQP